jgi:hypothetical protein
MKKIFYLVAPIVISVSLYGCAAFVQTSVYDRSSQPGYTNNSPANYNAPQPDYNNRQTNYDNSPQTNQVFYDELSPFGTWIDYTDYGYVWIPDNVGNDFRPYATNGYWVYSDYGWTWVSNYSWGWAPFHYGRWFYDDSYGWMWMPGQEWAPAWVTWGSYGDYYCWAPIAPNVNISTGGWAPTANSWNVVQRRHIARHDMNNYIVRTNAAVIKNVAVINNINSTNNNHRGDQGNRGRDRGNNVNSGYDRGPGVNDVENATNTRIQTVSVKDNTRPGAQLVSGNQLLVYRPSIKQNTPQENSNPAPHRVGTFKPGNGAPGNQQQLPGTNQNPERNQRQNNPQPQQQQNPKPDVNPNNNSRPNNPQPQQPPQNPKPDVNPNSNQRPNNPQPQQPPQNPKPDVNPYNNQRPNNPQPQQQQNPKPDVTPNNNQRSNNPQPQQPQNPKPDVNPNNNQRPNNPQPQQLNPRPNIQPYPQQTKPNFWQMNKTPKNPERKADTLKHLPAKQ